MITLEAPSPKPMSCNNVRAYLSSTDYSPEYLVARGNKIFWFHPFTSRLTGLKKQYHERIEWYRLCQCKITIQCIKYYGHPFMEKTSTYYLPSIRRHDADGSLRIFCFSNGKIILFKMTHGRNKILDHWDLWCSSTWVCQCPAWC